jgi:hypothetical protein
MGLAVNGGSFQFAFTLEKAEQIEKPATVPPENPQIGSMVIRAMKTNTGIIYLGGEGVSASNGFELSAGDSISADIEGAGKLWGFATKAADKVCVFWVGP